MFNKGSITGPNDLGFKQNESVIVPTPPEPPVTYEPETTAFLEFEAINIPNDGTIYNIGTAQEITGAGFWTALDLFIVTVKNTFALTLGINNLSTQFKFIYPRIGGTATTHKINLVDPLTFAGAFFGGWIHDGTGALTNGINTYFDTNCLAMTYINSNDVSIGVDLKTNIDELSTEFYSIDGARGNLFLRPKFTALLYSQLSQGVLYLTDVMISSTIGLFSMARTGAASYKVFREGVLLSSHIEAATTPMSNMNIIEAANNGSQFSTRKRTLFFAGLGMTDTQLLNFTAAWRAFETTLNR